MTRDQELLLKAVQRVGRRRHQNRMESRTIVLELAELAKQALDSGLPLTFVAEAAGVSRQTIYTLTGAEGK